MSLRRWASSTALLAFCTRAPGRPAVSTACGLCREAPGAPLGDGGAGRPSLLRPWSVDVGGVEPGPPRVGHRERVAGRPCAVVARGDRGSAGAADAAVVVAVLVPACCERILNLKASVLLHRSFHQKRATGHLTVHDGSNTGGSRAGSCRCCGSGSGRRGGAVGQRRKPPFRRLRSPARATTTNPPSTVHAGRRRQDTPASGTVIRKDHDEL